MSPRPGKRVTYAWDRPGDMKPHSNGTGSFAAFAVSDQMRRPVKLAAFDIIAIAKSLVPPSSDPRGGHYSDDFSTADTELRIRRLNRVVVEVVNDHDSAAAMEFGSGSPSTGKSKGDSRPQGGFNTAKRPLGTAGGRVGQWKP